MTEPRRIMRPNAKRDTPVPPLPLRTARRTVLEEPAQRSTQISTHHRQSTVSESRRDEALPPVQFDSDEVPCKVEIGHGKTIGLPNFSSIRIDVRITMPCREAELEDTIVRVSDMVTETLAAEEEHMLGAVAPQRIANRRG